MLRFLLGLVSGAIVSFMYVQYDIEFPKWMVVHETLRDSAAAAAAHEHLYDLSLPIETRQRALEVYIRHQPKKVTGLDAEYGHPFLKILYRWRAAREARMLRAAWDAFDVALSKSALRARLEIKHGTSETIALKQAMLAEQLKRKPFLASWIEKTKGKVPNETLLETLKVIGRLPMKNSSGAL